MRTALPTGTVTFLFTDVEGSTRLLNELGAQAYARALAEHRKVIREACLTQGGVEVDTQGDPFFFAFPTAPGALSAASELTERLAGLGPIRVKIFAGETARVDYHPNAFTLGLSTEFGSIQREGDIGPSRRRARAADRRLRPDVQRRADPG